MQNQKRDTGAQRLLITIPIDQSAFRVGVISDTHGLLRPEAAHALQEAKLIIHAGDIGTSKVVGTLREIAPVIAVRGNMDQDGFGLRLPETESLQIGPLSIHVLHDILRFYGTRQSREYDLVISGHTHRPTLTRSGRTTFLNPGSAGPKRSGLPITLAILEIEGEQLSIHHVDLESLGLKTPSGTA